MSRKPGALGKNLGKKTNANDYEDLALAA